MPRDSKPCAFRCGGRSCGNRDLPRVCVPRLRLLAEFASQAEFDAAEALEVPWGAFGKTTSASARAGLAPVANAIGFPLFYCPLGSGPQSYTSAPRMCTTHFREADVVRHHHRSLHHHPEVLSPAQSAEEHGLDVERYESLGTRMFRLVSPATPRFSLADKTKAERTRRLEQHVSMGAAVVEHYSAHATLTVVTQKPPTDVVDVAHCDTERVHEFNSDKGLGAKLTWTPARTTLSLHTSRGIGWQQAPIVIRPNVTATGT